MLYGDVMAQNRPCCSFSSLLFAVFLLLLFPIQTVFAENSLSETLAPPGWIPLSQPTSHPALLLALKSPTTQSLAWNLTQSPGATFPPTNESERLAFVEQDFVKLGLSPSGATLLANEKSYFSTVVGYSQQKRSFIAGILSIDEPEKSRVLFSTFVGTEKDVEEIKKLLAAQTSRLKQFRLLHPAAEGAPQKLASSTFIFLIAIGIFVFFALLYGWYKWKIQKTA